jgi:hypothetical protein
MLRFCPEPAEVYRALRKTAVQSELFHRVLVDEVGRAVRASRLREFFDIHF